MVLSSHLSCPPPPLTSSLYLLISRYNSFARPFSLVVSYTSFFSPCHPFLYFYLCLFLARSEHTKTCTNHILIYMHKLQHTATNCSTLQHTATHCSTVQQGCNTLHHTAPHCTTLHHTATHCNTLQYSATHRNTLQHTATHCDTSQRISNTLQHTAAHCSTLQPTATHCNTLQYLSCTHLRHSARAQIVICAKTVVSYWTRN